ncbi:histidine phosphatase family protein [Solwaraspora sp. WMMD1047]|uniref:SixA phosphatase family protein n=1 Tax=Solwaraspora sp. WMMD1047 TaxID=3016102 RepID=UPI002415E70B|nr:histidine phosphatase family protein [Solwaraspora sp. WMMD1047]MDG4834583.1 histidine phosphatase family protein [Solwaraspora sp. WMMD1047]
MTDRRIVLLRHAKAERPHGGPDIDRELVARGVADAMAAGAWLAEAGYRPDLVLCSPASRTRQTWAAIADLLLGEPEVRYDSAIYGGSAARLLKLARAVDPAVTTLLLIGHNPTMSELSDLLSTDDTRPSGADLYGLRTAGLVVHRVDGAWSELTFGAAPVEARHTARG